MIEKPGRIWVIVGVLALSALVLGIVGALPVRSQSGSPVQPANIQSLIDETIGYQGYLTDDDGNPLSDTYTMRFELYRESSGGAPVFESGDLNVPVSNGLFDIGLDVPQDVFNGDSLWLAIIVDGETLSPRQQIRPAPYAMSLRPGATVTQAATGTAVRVESTEGVGLRGAGQVYGLYGTNTGSTQGTGYGGYFESTTGDGVFGGSTAVPSTTNSIPAGVYGYSENGAGVYGEAGSTFAWGGYFDGSVRIDGSLVVSDSIFADDKSGYVFDVALNEGPETLNRGDVVIVTGVAGGSVSDAVPVFTVQRSSRAASAGVVGIVDRRYVLDEDGRQHMEDGPVAPGEEVGVVTLGAFQGVKVDASYGAIRPGDLLVSSPTPGHAMRADDPGAGTVVGKALDGLDAGTGTIAVMVTLQ